MPNTSVPAAATGLPTSRGLRSPRLRLVPVESDVMEPTLRSRLDHALCMPVTKYAGAGIYLLDDGCGGQRFRRAEIRLGGGPVQVMTWNDNPVCRSQADISLEDFEDRVLAIVVAEVRVSRPELLREVADA